MAKKEDLKERKPPFGSFNTSNRAIGSRTSYPTVVYWHFGKQNFGIPTNTKSAKEKQDVEEDNLVRVERGVIEDAITSISISAQMGSPSKQFSLTLLPSENWKRKLAAGDWIIIYMNQDYGPANKYDEGKLPNNTGGLLIGNIDRVARTLEKNEDTDKTELRYTVSGRNFGKVFEKTDIWFDPYGDQIESLDVALRTAGLRLQGNPTELSKTLLDVFLGEGGQFPDGRTSSLECWPIPPELSRAVGAKGATGRFFDILQVEIEDNLPGYKANGALNLESNGSLHDLLQQNSNSVVNELFYEEVRDQNGLIKPTLVLRPRPLNTVFYESHADTTAQSKKALNDKIVKLQDFAKENYLEISKAEIQYEDIGRDDHSKFNMFWLSTSKNIEGGFSALTSLNKKSGITNPTINSASIRRDGLRRYDQMLDFCHLQGSSGPQKNPGSDIELLTAYMTQLYDMHYANHLYDAGTITCTGILEAELGKPLVVLPNADEQGAKSKLYYIEGYEHNWTFPRHWETTMTVTHGQWKDNGLYVFIDVEKSDWGEDDNELQNAFLTKTNSTR